MSTPGNQLRRSVAGVVLSRMVERHKAAVVTVAALVPLVACAVLAVFRESLPAATDVLVLVLFVIAAASTGLRLAGISAALSAGFWFDLFLTSPYGQLTINDPDEVEATVLLVVIGVAVTEVALWGLRQQASAQRRAGYLVGVLKTAEILTLSTESPEAMTLHVAAQIKEVLTVNRCEFVLGPVHDPRICVLGHDGTVTRGGHRIDVDRDGLPTDDHIALMVARSGLPVGHFLLTSASTIARPSLEQRRVAVLLADQVGQVVVEPR